AEPIRRNRDRCKCAAATGVLAERPETMQWRDVTQPLLELKRRRRATDAPGNLWICMKVRCESKKCAL
ncbi:MAG: hypothetical protein ACWGMY_09095, partial [Hyphomicrobiaceae bacterium]